IEIESASVLRKQIQEIKALTEGKHFAAALMVAWATFEAMGRAVTPHHFKVPQTPGRLVQMLAGEGHLTPTEADDLRLLAEKRNNFIHGGLKTQVTKPEIDGFIAVLQTLMKTVSK